ncbi:macro domain-containing protein [Streptomyces sp. NPDC051985]|uniref:macro domain-containing protein n=1 Tax=Streptomyces sp. NPDC051985 TaxID=3155807 RepID=UPI003424F503
MRPVQFVRPEHSTIVNALRLSDYADAIALDEPFRPVTTNAPDRPVLVRAALADLIADGTAARLRLSRSEIERVADEHPAMARQLLTALLTVRPAGGWSPAALSRVDSLLSAEAADRVSVSAKDLPRINQTHPASTYPAADRTALWRGDRTALAADAVVNAANGALLGCFALGHGCVDNTLHSAAGPRMRVDCARVMELQGHPEPTGSAKITRGYHLPARHVLHTVGPVVDGSPDASGAQALVSCYRSCLDLAAEAGARTVAFSPISTGAFGYPRLPAARVALATVAGWLRARPGTVDLVVFDVSDDADHTSHTSVLNELPVW